MRTLAEDVQTAIRRHLDAIADHMPDASPAPLLEAIAHRRELAEPVYAGSYGWTVQCAERSAVLVRTHFGIVGRRTARIPYKLADGKLVPAEPRAVRASNHLPADPTVRLRMSIVRLLTALAVCLPVVPSGDRWWAALAAAAAAVWARLWLSSSPHRASTPPGGGDHHLWDLLGDARRDRLERGRLVAWLAAATPRLSPSAVLALRFLAPGLVYVARSPELGLVAALNLRGAPLRSRQAGDWTTAYADHTHLVVRRAGTWQPSARCQVAVSMRHVGLSAALGVLVLVATTVAPTPEPLTAGTVLSAIAQIVPGSLSGCVLVAVTARSTGLHHRRRVDPWDLVAQQRAVAAQLAATAAACALWLVAGLVLTAVCHGSMATFVASAGVGAAATLLAIAWTEQMVTNVTADK